MYKHQASLSVHGSTTFYMHRDLCLQKCIVLCIIIYWRRIISMSSEPSRTTITSLLNEPKTDQTNEEQQCCWPVLSSHSNLD